VDISATKAEEPPEVQVPSKRRPQEIKFEVVEPATDVLRKNDINVLYHFTDAANLASIRKHGLLAASCLERQSIEAVMNSDASSRTIDAQMGLQNFVRLSFNKENPMKHVAKKEGRISSPVMLQIKLEIVLKTGVLFFDCNATRHDAVQSSSPNVVRFDVVNAANQFRVPEDLRRFYQAEVLVPSPVPADLIVFPADDAKLSAGKKELKPKVSEIEKAESCKTRRSSMSSSTSLSSSTTFSTASIVSLAEGEAATSLILQDDVISVLGVEGDKLQVPTAAAACALPGASKSRAARCRDVFSTVPAAAADSDFVPALPGASKSRAARGRVLPDVDVAAGVIADPALDVTGTALVVADVANCALPSVSDSSTLSDVDRLHHGSPAIAPVSALPGVFLLLLIVRYRVR
jgi:hypothetical protein